MGDVQDLFIDGPVGTLSVRTRGLGAKPREVVILVQGSNLTGGRLHDEIGRFLKLTSPAGA